MRKKSKKVLLIVISFIILAGILAFFIVPKQKVRLSPAVIAGGDDVWTKSGSCTYNFTRGDTNLDGQVDIGDGIKILNVLFQSREGLYCYDRGDVNDDNRVDISDAVYIFSYLYSGGPAPKSPFPEKGTDEPCDGKDNDNDDIIDEGCQPHYGYVNSFSDMESRNPLSNPSRWKSATAIFSSRGPIIICNESVRIWDDNVKIDCNSIKSHRYLNSYIEGIKRSHKKVYDTFQIGTILYPFYPEPIINLVDYSEMAFSPKEPKIIMGKLDVKADEWGYAHELAHYLQYYYLKMADIKMRLNYNDFRSFEEGFAMMTELCLYKNSNNSLCDKNLNDPFPYGVYGHFNSYLTYQNLTKKNPDFCWEKGWDGPYCRGALFFVLLRERYDCDFNHCVVKWFKYMAEKYSYKNGVTIADIQDGFNYATGRDVSDLFNEFGWRYYIDTTPK